MCQFCAEHGDGRTWYLRAENYAENLLSDVRRREFIRDFFSPSEEMALARARMESLRRAPPFVRRALSALITRRMKPVHFGQVLPLEDLREILGFVNSIVRVACICRRATLGRDVGYCYAISMGPGGGRMAELVESVDPSFLHGPDTAGLDELTPDQALAAFADHEREGLCHTVWTFRKPFIGGLCNCDRTSCMSMQATVVHDVKMMWRAEYVAAVDPELCVGCRECMGACQFGALAFNPADRKVVVDQTACYGCGVCRSVCAQDAITLRPRAEVPQVAKLW